MQKMIVYFIGTMRLNLGVWGSGNLSGSNPEDLGSIPSAPARNQKERLGGVNS